jgi:hypothetical protein
LIFAGTAAVVDVAAGPVGVFGGVAVVVSAGLLQANESKASESRIAFFTLD